MMSARAAVLHGDDEEGTAGDADGERKDAIKRYETRLRVHLNVSTEYT